MKNIKMVVLILFFTIVFSSGLFAKYYQYTDENGNISYTDDPSQIPRSQLDQADTFDSVESQNQSEPRLGQDHKQIDGKIEPDLKTWDGQLRFVAEELELKQKKLRKMYNELEDEKVRLEKISTKTLSSAEKQAYNSSIKALNLNIKEYKKQYSELKSDINKFYE